MTNQNQTALPFRNHELGIEQRVADLISRFTLEEKIGLMCQYQQAVERLGVKPYKHGTEASHGIAWLGEATSFPQPIGLACTWNPELLKRIGSVIGDEARVFYQRDPARNGLTLWAPTVDMERDPRWGRTEEAYGEDPLLTGELTTALVKGIQGPHPIYRKAVATLKHFLGNNNEKDRGHCSASIDPRNMREYYLKAFEPAFRDGGALSMMTAYNSINGTPAILHPDVLRVVKGEWGMNGFIVSDAGDLIGLVKDHHYFESYKEAVAASIKNGIDSITDDADIICSAFREALADGLLEEGDLDRALTNTFRVRFLLGEFDPDDRNPYAAMPDETLCKPEHAALSLEAARESIVLLKNNRQMLPLDQNAVQRVAVIGPLGDTVFRDWYAGSYPYKITPLQGIRARMKEGSVVFADGCDRVRFRSAVTGQYVGISPDNGALKADRTGADSAETFLLTDWGFGSVTLKALSNGNYVTTDDTTVTASADDIWGWHVKEVFQPAEGQGGTISLASWNGSPVTLPGDEGGALRKEVVTDGLKEAIAAAEASDVAVVVVGNHPLINGKEEIDRQDLTLAASQERLIQEVYRANRNTVVVVIGSYPFALNWVDEHIPAVLYLSHAGQELGNALADVLFGDYNPAGRLNMTWYRSMEQLPDMMNYDIRKGKRTYQYFDGEALYPFGHGLSYSTFRYEELHISPEIADSHRDISVSVRVENKGDMAGDEVVQLYVRADSSRVQRPLKELKGFRRIHVAAGEKRTVRFTIPVSSLAIWDVSRDVFCIESGTYTFMIGSSSGDIRMEKKLTVDGETVPPRDVFQETPAVNYDDYDCIYLDECREDDSCCIRLIGESGWLRFDDADFRTGIGDFEARCSSGKEGGKIELRLDALDGPLIGTCIVPVTGGHHLWETVNCKVDEVSGVRSLFLCLGGDIGLSRFRLLPRDEDQ